MTEHKGNIEHDLELLELAKKIVEEADQSAKKHPTSEEIQIIMVEPHKRPYKATIKNELKSFNDIVNGYMENWFIGNYDGLKIALVCNEEGRRLKMPFNRRVVGLDMIVGTFFITAYNMQGDNVSLSDELTEDYIKRFTPLEVYL